MSHEFLPRKAILRLFPDFAAGKTQPGRNFRYDEVMGCRGEFSCRRLNSQTFVS
jgi:hypothetical protein